jgi:hypothetical protein
MTGMHEVRKSQHLRTKISKRIKARVRNSLIGPVLSEGPRSHPGAWILRRRQNLEVGSKKEIQKQSRLAYD